MNRRFIVSATCRLESNDRWPNLHTTVWLLSIIGLLALTPTASWAQGVISSRHYSDDGIWTTIDRVHHLERAVGPRKYSVHATNEVHLRGLLQQAPMESTRHGSDLIITVPMPDGGFERVAVEESPIFSPELQAQYPDMRTYHGIGVDNPRIQGRLDFTPAGFHAMLFTDDGVVFVDPDQSGERSTYISYWKADVAGESFTCDVDGATAENLLAPLAGSFPANNPSGTQLRTYRLAVSVTGEYTQHFGGTTQAAAQITTTVNRVTGIYEHDVAIRLNLVSTRIFDDPATDPFPQFCCDNRAGTSGCTATTCTSDAQCTGGKVCAAATCDLRSENQATLDANPGNANYDIGHVFGAGGGGGVASLGSVCVTGSKARGCTSLGNPSGDAFDVDFVAHEIGHQFGGNHTWSGNTCDPGGQFVASAAYEPASGTTIMAYAGVCSAQQNIQPHSDPFFHTRSFDEIRAFVTSGNGSTCGTTAATGNNPPTVEAEPDCTIPQSTPFTLTAQGADDDGDSLTFDWEQFDAASALVTGTPSATATSGPLFRSFPATASSSRTFPRFQDILSGAATPFEVLPAVDRTLNFRVTARDNRAGGGGVDWDAMQVTVSGSPFQIVSPAQGAQLECGDQTTITWNVGGGSVAPNVDIQTSTDGGASFSTLVAGTANDGSEQVTAPKVLTDTGRVMLRPTTECFFSVSKNFSIADTKAPMLTAPPEVTVECTAPTGTPVNLGTPTVSDLCDPSPAVTNNAPAVFQLGNTTVTWTAQDASHNQSTAPQTVKVQDTTAPTVQASLSQTHLWAPNHNLLNVGLNASVSDVCDPNPTIRVTVFGDEDDEEPTGDGGFSPDAKDISLSTLRLRAERGGNTDGRVYLIVVKATDASGNVAVDCGTVAVPHDLRAISIASVNAQAAVAKAFCLANNGTAPPGSFVIGDGIVIGPKQ